MQPCKILVIGILALVALWGAPLRAEVASLDRLRKELPLQLPEVAADDIHPTAAPGLFEVRTGGHVAYVTADGRYLVAGDMFEVKSRINLSEQARNADRQMQLSQLDPAGLIEFAPAAEPRHILTIFTDVDCPYCRKLHTEIAAINKLGIAIRYAAFPRTGPGTKSWRTMEAVWCSGDRKAALTHAKSGQEVKADACQTPIAQHYELGELVGVTGTPAMVAENGALLMGYMPPEELARRLDEVAPLSPSR